MSENAPPTVHTVGDLIERMSRFPADTPVRLLGQVLADDSDGLSAELPHVAGVFTDVSEDGAAHKTYLILLPAGSLEFAMLTERTANVPEPS
jgi:hypothetical protein